ncbi:MAG: M56 family metallopeptidase [bacterium]
MNSSVAQLAAFIQALGERYVAFSIPMLLQSSVVIAVVLLLERLLRNRVSAIFRYGLLLLIPLKLVLPTSLEGPFAVERWLDREWLKAEEKTSLRDHDIFASANPAPLIAAKEAPSQESETKNIQDTKTVTILSVETLETRESSVALLKWEGLLFGIWIGGVGCLIIVLLVRLQSVYFLLRHAQPIEPEFEEILENCRTRIGLRRHVRCGYTEDLHSPAVCGILRFTILLPRATTEKLGHSELESILLHELIHIQRLDPWVSWLQTVLQIAYFYHPLFWLANWRIRDVREQAVDERTAIAAGRDARPYCRALAAAADLAVGRPAFALRMLGVFESRQSLKDRVKRLLQRPLPRQPRLRMRDYALLLVAGVLLLPQSPWKPAAQSTDTSNSGLAEKVASGPLISASADGDLIYDGKTFQEWISILENRQEGSWESLSRAIQHFGPRNGEAIPGLVDRVRNGRDTDNAEWLLGKLGPTAIPAILELMRDEDPTIRQRGVMATMYMGSDAKEAIPFLIESVTDEARNVRTHALLALGEIGLSEEDVTPGLTAAFQGSEWNERKMAAEALGRMGPKARAALPALIEALGDDQWMVRELAAKSLARMVGRMGEDVSIAVSPLIKAIEDKNWPVRLQAAVALGWMGPVAKEAVPALRKAQEDANKQVRDVAGVALQNIKRRSP